MKTRILSFAAMLLMSVSMFAQSVVKGDVNNDGVVDVADVAAVIDIMKNGGGVAVLPTSVEMKETTMVAIGSEVTLKATVLPENATDKTLTWTSSNTSVATVTNAGVVKGIAEGTATITATTVNGKTATCVVTVAEKVYYWYVGTTKPTSLDECVQVTEYESEVIYTNNSGAKSHIFVLTNSNKTVIFIEPSMNSPITQIGVDKTTISGYNIFETAVGVANTGSIKIKVE